MINCPLRDYLFEATNPVPLQSGLYFNDGTPKPALRAFRFPFVTERIDADHVRAWGKSPASGRLSIERRDGNRWKPVERRRVRQGQVFTERLAVRGKAKLRAHVGGDKSLVWTRRR